jgi:branched-chain amino acid transport system permease protein
LDISFFLIQILNSVQYGLLLFMVASGLTLIFGIMGIINLAHGSFYMIGAYLVFWLNGLLGNLLFAILLALPIAVAVGYAMERFLIAHLYNKEHLLQVLLTYGLILIFNEAQKIFWGNDSHGVNVPLIFSGSIPLTETQVYPVYRLVISLACLAIAFSMMMVIQKTKLGMMIRAGATNREMAAALGIDINRLFAIVFSLGAALAAFSGMIAAPVSSVYPGMGEHILIISFVVVVIGGVGSIKGAFISALLIGFADTFGKALVPGLSSVVIYALMALVLLWKPNGLFGRAGS